MIKKWHVPLGEAVKLPPEALPIHAAAQGGELFVWTNDSKGLGMLGMET